MKSLYFDKHRSIYISRSSFFHSEVARFAFFILQVDSKPWTTDLMDDAITFIEDPIVRLEKKDGLAILSATQLNEEGSRPYIIELEKLKLIVKAWYKAIEQQPVGILLVFNKGDIHVVPDIEAIGEDALVQQEFNKYSPTNYVYKTKKDVPDFTKFEKKDDIFDATFWPKEMSDESIVQSKQEAIDFLNTYNVKGFWDPYTKTLSYYGYAKDGLLIQFVYDEEHQYLMDFPILL